MTETTLLRDVVNADFNISEDFKAKIKAYLGMTKANLLDADVREKIAETTKSCDNCNSLQNKKSFTHCGQCVKNWSYKNYWTKKRG